MSACISRSGEFSEHSLDESHTCTRCHVLDEDALRAELEKLRAELAATRNNRLISAIFGHHKGAPRPFALYRREDHTGVSGTGVVAVGVEFPDGLVVLRWTSAFPTSVVFHERGIESVEAVHGHGGKTQIVWLSDELESLAEMEQQRDEARAELARYAERLDRRTAELRDAHNDLLDVRGILSPAGYEPVTPLPLVPTVAPAVQWLVDRLAAAEQDRDRLRGELEQAQPVLTAASNVVKVWRQWRVGRGKEVIPIKALALAVDVHTLAPVAAALTERECPGLPTTPGVLDDGMHCDHWYDGGPCCRCSTAAEPSGTEAGLDPNAPPIGAVLHVLGDVIAPDEPTGRTRCPLCKTLPIGHEGDCEP